ncbi:MAG: HlyD family secretion protein [Planctomycetaceae bacterium]
MTGLSGRRLLAPGAYSEAMMPSLQLTKSSRIARLIAKILLASLVCAFALAAFAPWQQSVKGGGSVEAFAPGERQQPIEAAIKGRIIEMGPGIVENAFVRKGDFILEIQDIDPDLMNRLEEQEDALQKSMDFATEQMTANQNHIDVILQMKPAINANLASYKSVKEQIEEREAAAIEAAGNKVSAMESVLAEAEADFEQIRLDYLRQKTLFEEDIVAEVKFQMAESKWLQAKAKVQKAAQGVTGAENDLKSKIADRTNKLQKAQVDIDKTSNELKKQDSELAKAKSKLAETQQKFEKARKDLSMMRNKVAQQRSQRVEAPMDGFLTQIKPNSGTQILKPGDLLCVIVPETKDRAVQLWMDGNDAPLIEPGRHVRLQFEGWPAVQFAGWPSVAVGTFGGEVISVDATDNGKGKFRVFVKPDPTDKPWPDTRYLRQGVRTNGWVLLDQVPLWFEIWRSMNGFPPVVSDDKAKSDKDEKKKPKLPKG